MKNLLGKRAWITGASNAVSEALRLGCWLNAEQRWSFQRVASRNLRRLPKKSKKQGQVRSGEAARCNGQSSN